MKKLGGLRYFLAEFIGRAVNRLRHLNDTFGARPFFLLGGFFRPGDGFCEFLHEFLPFARRGIVPLCRVRIVPESLSIETNMVKEAMFLVP